MNRKTILWILAGILILAGGLYAFLQFRNSSPLPQAEKTQNVETTVVSIPELGIQFNALPEIKDITYTIKDLGDFGKAAYFSSESLSALEPNCSSTYNSIGAIAVLDQKEWQAAQGGFETGSTTSSFDPNYPDPALQLGSKYIIYDGAGGLCAANADTTKLQRTQTTALLQSLSSLSLIPAAN